MSEKRSKYDTDPLDPDFVRRTEEMLGATRNISSAQTERQPQRDPAQEEPTRRFDEAFSNSYPSVFVPPLYQPPQQAQPHTTFGAGPGQPPATTTMPTQGPSSPYDPHARPSSRPVTRLGIAENVANVLPYAPFYIGAVMSIIELLRVPRHETRTRFHSAQGFALHAAILGLQFLFGTISLITGSSFGSTMFKLAAFIFLIVSMVRVWKGKPHHIAPLDDATAWINHKIEPMK
ncbi:MAG: hypothetical protein WCD76_12920 [Pyrinomonadaceae bacterium]